MERESAHPSQSGQELKLHNANPNTSHFFFCPFWGSFLRKAKEVDMKRFARLFVVTLGLAIPGLVVTLVPHKDAQAQGPTPVTVVNTGSNPVPTRAAQVGPWRVGALQTGAWSVNVENPVNSRSNPVPLIVRNVDEPGRIPYQSFASLNSCLAISCTFTFNNPGTGHRLVVQHISGSWNNTTPGATLVVVTSADSGAARSAFDKTADSSITEFFFDQPVLFYVDPGRSFSVLLSVTSGNSLGGGIFVSGYLVDCGASPCAPIAGSAGTS
jgi:hypothetical protein